MRQSYSSPGERWMASSVSAVPTGCIAKRGCQNGKQLACGRVRIKVHVPGSRLRLLLSGRCVCVAVVQPHHRYRQRNMADGVQHRMS